MTEEGRRESARSELELADEELRAAEGLLRDGVPRIAIARTCFAVFRALRAQLYAEGFEPRTHGGAQHLFNLHFVRTGGYEPSTSRLIARLQKYREDADYARPSWSTNAARSRSWTPAADSSSWCARPWPG